MKILKIFKNKLKYEIKENVVIQIKILANL